MVSNGHAEDLTAAATGAGIKKVIPDLKIRAFPLVGLGKAYDAMGIENLGIKKVMPSGGFAKEGFRYLFKDIGAGLFGTLFRQIRILKNEAKRTDIVVCMGDIFLVALCGFFTKKPIIFVDGPNSVRIKEYYPIERWIMHKFCRKIVVQDEETAVSLQKRGLPGLYLGTWVMDYVSITGEDFGIASDKTVIGMLPGTREEAYHNLLLILEVFEEMNCKQKLLGLMASVLDQKKIKEKIKAAGWEFSDASESEKTHAIVGEIKSASGAEVLIAEGKFGDVCNRSKLVIGLAGIANEQAAGFGAPVVCFPSHGPQTTLRRWKEIHNITGDSMAILTGNTEEIAQKTLDILNNPQLLGKMAQIGWESKKDRGGIERIANLIVETIQRPE